MDWKSWIKHKTVQRVGSIVLAAAVTISMGLPALNREHAPLENPILQEEIKEITVLQAGEGKSYASNSSAIDPDAEGTGGGQVAGETGAEGGSALGESSEASQGVSQEQKNVNVQGTPKPDSGPSIEQLSQSEIGSQQQAEQQGEQSQQDGVQGEEGGEEVEIELGAVMNWYKYGNQAKTIVCQPGSTVGKQIMTAQLKDDRLKYDFTLTGTDAPNTEITSVTYSEGNSVPKEIDASGSVPVLVQADPGYKNYIFQVTAEVEKENKSGDKTKHEVDFTFVIRCESGKDLDLELTWQKADGQSSTITCAANKTAAREIKQNELNDGQLHYVTALSGELARDSEIVSASYTTASGSSGTLSPMGGSLQLQTPEGKEEETYYLTFLAQSTMRDEDGDTVQEKITYQVTIVYQSSLDLQLNFTWFEKGVTKRELICEKNESVSDRVKNNQLSAGALMYEMKLTGDSAPEARIKAVALQSGSGSSSLQPSGSFPMTIPAGETAATYTLTVTAEVQEQKVTFTIQLRYSNDVSLQMRYTSLVDGAAQQQLLTCENQKSVTAELIFDDQLTDDLLSYELSILGEDASGVTITEVRCYQSGTGKTVTLSPSGSVQLALNKGKTGDNTFTVKAKDEGGQEYTFTINIPYKHRGDNLVKIATNLTDGMEVTNGTEVNLNVRAWTEDADGNTVSYIYATGTNGTKITVTLDGVEIPYISAAGSAQEYTLIPEDPEVGDTNEHTLYIYAEDEHGNYGELTLTLIGKRTQGGQEIGTAQIYIDLTVLGLGVTGPVSYTVLSEEPVSYVVAKALWGYDAGDPFGTSENTFGWVSGSYGGTFDVGFYLRSLTSGGPVGANALSGTRWNDFGATEEEILQYIDDYFGRGTGLATLWRCIYRNGLNLSTASGSAISEFDYTSGSGWLYSIGGGSYYPGQSMSDYYLKDGDTLTLRYTLAQGWDIGGGTDNYGNTVGYCVSAMNGSISVNHQMEEVVNEETGAVGYICRCCGLIEACPHENTEYKDLGDGTHSVYCNDCATTISEAQEHQWAYSDTENPETHTRTCTECGLVETEMHQWTEASNTATCTETGVRTVTCAICGVTQEQESPAKGHQTDNQYFHDVNGHYQICEVCGLEIEGSRGAHDFRYDAGWDDWYCSACNAGHDWDYCGNAGLVLRFGSTCENLVYDCPTCGAVLTKSAAHQYVDGICIVCLAEDLSHETPTVPENPEPPVTPETPTPPEDDEDEEETGGEPGGDGPDPEEPDPPQEPETPNETEEAT